MRRNLIIIIFIILGIFALMITGNIIIVGEKIASVTRLWWMELIFYGVLLFIFSYYVLRPIWRIHRTPAFPVLAVDDEASEEQLKEYGKRLANHCDFIENDQQRKEHKKGLEKKLLMATKDHNELLNVVKDELKFRYEGDKDKGILGINGLIKEWAKTVFMISALSQNSKLDTISVMWLNFKLIESLVLSSGFRPNNRQMFKIYCDILTTALITYVMSEALMKSSGVKPFDFGEAHDSATEAVDTANSGNAIDNDTPDYDPDDITFDSQMFDSEGLSLYSILRRIKIPGVIVSSALDGAVNALMTLRIGYITRTYLQNGEQAFTGISKKRAVKSQAMKDSRDAITEVVASGSTLIGKKTAYFIKKLIERNYSKEDNVEISKVTN